MSAMLDVGRRRLLRCVVVSGACLGVAGCALGGRHTISRMAVTTPAVLVPISSTPSNFPFIADGFGPEPPVPSGCEEAEYFVSGRAKLYEYSATGVRTAGPSDVNFGLTAAGSLPSGDPRNRMQPHDSPMIQINTESEEVLPGAPTGLTYHRPDSDARNDRYRLREVPGASHISNDLGSSPITEERDLAEIDRTR